MKMSRFVYQLKTVNWSRWLYFVIWGLFLSQAQKKFEQTLVSNLGETVDVNDVLLRESLQLYQEKSQLQVNCKIVVT